MLNKNGTSKKLQWSDFVYDQGSNCFIPKNFYDNEYFKKFRYSDGVKVENTIFEIINKAEDISYDSDELMSRAFNWPTLYHLGIGRANTFESITLRKNIKNLEIGSGCGAITRYLGERFYLVDAIEGSFVRAQITRARCRDLTNVNVYCANVSCLEATGNYDLITLNGVLEYSPMYITGCSSPEDACSSFLLNVSRFLKKNGLLIVAIENKIGIKYFSGCPDDHTGTLFDGIHNYPVKNSPITFSKNELITILKNAGFYYIDFYYCFPDYKFASTVISDECPQQNLFLHNWIQTPFRFYDLPRKYLFHEGLALKTLSQANLIKEFANSFFIVASQTKPVTSYQKPDWAVKRYTLNRKKEFQCVTTLKYSPKISVVKKRLYSSRNAITSNQFFSLTHRVGETKWYSGELLLFEIQKIVQRDDFFCDLVTLFNVYKKQLIEEYATSKVDKDGFQLLRGESIDALLSNLIRTDKGFVFIDTEWDISENLPIDYVVYRCFIKDVEKQIPSKLKKTNKFRISFMKSLFDNYSAIRDRRNRDLEIKFQSIIGAENHNIIFRVFTFLKLIKDFKILRTVWNKLPEKIKEKIRHAI